MPEPARPAPHRSLCSRGSVHGLLARLFALLATTTCTPSGPTAATLRVALWATGHELEVEQRVADRYEILRPGTRVLLESAPNGYEERLLTSIAAGHPPDIYLLDSPDIPTFVDRGLATDLAPFGAELGFAADSIFPQVLDAFRRGGSIFALPKDFTPMVIYANRAVLEAAGVETPPLAGWTWDDFRAAAAAVTADRDGDGRPDSFGFDFPRNLYQWVPFVWSAGGDILSPGGTAASGFMDGPEALEAYAFLTGLAEDGLTPGAQFVQRGDPAREARFASGGQAFLLSGHWTLRVFRDLVDEGSLDLAVLPIPHHPSRTRATSVLYASGVTVRSGRGERPIVRIVGGSGNVIRNVVSSVAWRYGTRTDMSAWRWPRGRRSHGRCAAPRGRSFPTGGRCTSGSVSGRRRRRRAPRSCGGRGCGRGATRDRGSGGGRHRAGS